MSSFSNQLIRDALEKKLKQQYPKDFKQLPMVGIVNKPLPKGTLVFK